ncbi:unnamed protein product [Eruca vesicaria subsp. sativa]|uniref:Uncharacterized protein n=1 Tax=Eruca vesicaria subsp. sativa TaxID=29727 RepID=A0ABC8L5B3_ERUVS|nr:unnamed protein product [Eruca vesicaria subsp. sativa]
MLVALGFGRHRGSDLSVLVFGGTARLGKLEARAVAFFYAPLSSFSARASASRSLVLCDGACGPNQSQRFDLGRVSDLSLGEGAGLVCLLGFWCGGVALSASSPS